MELIFRGKERKAIRKKSSLLRLLVQCTVRWMCVGVSGAGGRGDRDAAAVLPPALASVRFGRISIDFYSDAAVANVTSISNWMR